MIRVVCAFGPKPEHGVVARALTFRVKTIHGVPGERIEPVNAADGLR